MLNCSFTGHRAIEQRHSDRLESLLQRAIDYVYSEGCLNFYTGGALGFDTMAAKLLIKFKMKNRDVRIIVVVPCKGQADKWSASQRDMYEYVLSNADEIIYLSDEYDKECMRRRNRYLAETCDVLIAYSGRDRSGSGQTVRMARDMNKTVYNLFSALEQS